MMKMVSFIEKQDNQIQMKMFNSLFLSKWSMSKSKKNMNKEMLQTMIIGCKNKKDRNHLKKELLSDCLELLKE